MTCLKIKKLLSAIAIAISVIFAMSSCDLSIYADIPKSFVSGGGTLVAHYLDVGQGDSIFIELPNNETMLIDAGENYHGASIIEYIRDCGRDRIDYLIGTHPHTDHIGSMAYIVRNFDIGSVYLPNVSTNTYTYQKLLEAVKKKGLKVKTGKSGVKLLDDSDDDLRITILGPVKTDVKNLNNASIVLKIEYGETSFLFMGDAEKAELEELDGDISAKVLKVGHHGSYTSTTKDFLERVKPEIAVISCGKGNDYGHPNKSVLKLLKNSGCEIYRTDKQKTITVTGDGEALSVLTGGEAIR